MYKRQESNEEDLLKNGFHEFSLQDNDAAGIALYRVEGIHPEFVTTTSSSIGCLFKDEGDEWQ